MRAGRPAHTAARPRREESVHDVLMVLLVAVLFGLMAGLARICDSVRTK